MTIVVDHIFSEQSLSPKHGEKLRVSGWIVYGTLRELFKRKLVDLVHSSNRFSFHSCRHEGAMAPANSAAQDCLFKTPGRWKYKEAKMVMWRTPLRSICYFHNS